MEITAGLLHGMSLKAPAGLDVRPTAVRARQALFDSLGDLSGKIFVDLCAGSGAMGLEAASRGAASVIFAECAPASLAAIRSNCRKAAEAGLTTDLEIIEGKLPDSITRLAARPRPHIVFADPPYPISADLLSLVTGNALFAEWACDAVLIWELPSERHGLRPPGPAWQILSIRTLGPAEFLFLTSRKEKKAAD